MIQAPAHVAAPTELSPGEVTSPVPCPAVPHGSEQGMQGHQLCCPLPCVLQAVPLHPFLLAQGLIASCICQPQGFPANSALPGIEALGLQLSVINPKKRREKEGRKSIPSSCLWLTWPIRCAGFIWSGREEKQRWWRKRGKYWYRNIPCFRGSAVDPHMSIFHPSCSLSREKFLFPSS